MPVAIAVNRDGPKKPSIGIKYTNAGRVCPASKIGRNIRSARALRPIQTPKTTPTAMVSKVATMV
ncbi:unannotated protein [freshwater metagenome]|uniref:Unannotated protein n=1 Tax=freshwater metagenome TaxID=449393 RepID=A0A6J5Z858_9ZZZZ